MPPMLHFYPSLFFSLYLDFVKILDTNISCKLRCNKYICQAKPATKFYCLNHHPCLHHSLVQTSSSAIVVSTFAFLLELKVNGRLFSPKINGCAFVRCDSPSSISHLSNCLEALLLLFFLFFKKV